VQTVYFKNLPHGPYVKERISQAYWKVLREKIIIGVLIGLGYLAVASIMKAVAAARFGNTDDANTEGTTMGAWTLIEDQVAFIATSVLCLRSLFQSLMVKIGAATTRNAITKGIEQQRIYGEDWHRWSHQVESMTGDSPSEENILSMDGKPGIWRTTEVKMEEEEIRRMVQRSQQKGSRDRV